MARGGYRPGAGRKKKNAVLECPAGATAKPKRAAANDPIPDDVRVAADAHGQTPLDYALEVMNNAEADQSRRDRMCAIALPFCHPKIETAGAGKKQERDEAAGRAATGKFAPPEPPKLVVNNS